MTKRLLTIVVLCLSAFAANADTTDELLRKADSAISQNEFSTALIHLKNAVKQDKSNHEALLKLAQLFVLTGQGIQALEEINRLQRQGARPEEITLLRAHALFLTGEYQQIIDYEDLLKLPQSQIARYRAMQGHALFAQRKFQRARMMFQRAMALGKDELEVQLGRVKLLRLDGQAQAEKQLVSDLLRLYPNRADVLIEAGAHARATGEFDKALEYYQAAGKIQPSNINVWFGSVRSYIGKGDYTEARREAEKIIAAYPEHQVANYLLAIVEFQEGNYTRARSAAELVLKGDKHDFEALLLLASIQFQLKEYSRAEENLSKFLSSFPDNEEALKTLAAVYLKRRQGGKALEILLPLQKSDDAYVNSMISSAYMLVGNQEKSDFYLSKSLQISPDDEVLKRRFQRNKLESGQSLKLSFKDTDYDNFLSEGHIAILDLIVQKKFDEAAKLVNGYMKTMPNYELLHYLLGTIRLGQGDVQQARAEFQHALKIKPDFVEPRIYLAKILARGGDSRGAEREYREVLKYSDNNDEALVGLAAIFQREGNEDEMLKWLARSRKSNSGSLASREVLERYYRERGDIGKAVELSQEMVGIQPQNIGLLRRHGLNQKAAGRLDLAIRAFDEIVKLQPQSVAAWSGLGHLQYLNDEFLPAITSYQKVLELDSKHLLAHVVLIQIDLKLGRSDAALKKAMTLKGIHPKHAASYDMLGDVYLKIDQPAKAVDAYSRSAELQYSSDTYLKLLTAYNRNDQVQKGFELLQQWVGKYPRDLALKEALALTYQRRGEFQKSYAIYEELLEGNRDNTRILNSLALLALELESPMSMEYAEKAYSLEPNNVSNADTLGWVLLKNQGHERALSLLAEAVKREPSNSNYRYHFAVALAEMGRKKEALTQLYLATGAPGAFANRKAAQELLEKLKTE